MPPKKILFLNLTAFSSTGGIEKFNRAFLKALSDLQREGQVSADSCSAYDDKVDTKYFPANSYKCFNGSKLGFAFWVLLNAHKYHTIILSHINLSSVAWIVKAFSPSKKILLVVHGIEVWRKLSKIQQKILQKADKILAVSAFTRQKLVEIHGINAGKITVFHNTIDPYFIYPHNFNKPQYLLDRYKLDAKDAVIFTLTRLSSTEKNKGYDSIIKVVSYLKKSYPGIKYILAGKYDESEKKRIDGFKQTNAVTERVLLTGFVKEEEVTDHYLLADVFILPSRKEGFGIVFIEAMACGLAVIGGNKDGSVDALKRGELGLLVDPDNETEILQALEKCLAGNGVVSGRKELQQKVYETFGFETFKQNLRKVLVPLSVMLGAVMLNSFQHLIHFRILASTT